MNTTTTETALYSIGTDPETSEVSIREVWKMAKGSSGGFCDTYVDMCAISTVGQRYFCGFDREREVCEYYLLKTDNTPVKAVEIPLSGKPYSLIRPLYVGGVGHLIAYDKVSGTIDFYRISGNCQMEHVLNYRKTYGIVSTGFTTLEPYYYRDAILMLGYNNVDGNAVIYSVSVPGKSPLSLSPVWTKGWAGGWCRFAFFQLGAENFFLKSNPLHKDVNIDHMVDNSAEGSHPVGTHLPLPLDLTGVTAFEMMNDPYFIGYHASTGGLTANRFSGDCLGWKEVASHKAVCNGTILFSMKTADGSLVMVY